MPLCQSLQDIWSRLKTSKTHEDHSAIRACLLRRSSNACHCAMEQLSVILSGNSQSVPSSQFPTINQKRNSQYSIVKSAHPMNNASIPGTAAICSTFSTPSIVSIIGMIITASFTTVEIVEYDSLVSYCVMAETIVTERCPWHRQS